MDIRIEAHMYAYDMCGSSPCEDCNNFRHMSCKRVFGKVYESLKYLWIENELKQSELIRLFKKTLQTNN